MHDPVEDQVRALRAALTRTPLSASGELTRALGISQSTLSRLIRRLPLDVLVLGRARFTRYAWRRRVDGVEAIVPVYEMPGAPGRPRHVADLHPVAPDGFVLESLVPEVASGWHDDLPWFLQELRPSGWLGRQVPALHADLHLPPHVNDWSSDHLLRFLVERGFDGLGAFVVGAQAYRHAVAVAQAPTSGVRVSDRLVAYAARADAAVQQGVVGSSAGGEQPKFLATRDHQDRQVPVLVKFSPAARDPVATRRRDLLVCEHLALSTLAEHGHPAARSELLVGETRVYLEVERFDRDGPSRRLGQIALASADAQLVGSSLTSWAESTSALVGRGLLSAEDHRVVRWRQVFGAWIANTDMHLHNLTLRLRGAMIAGVAPAYDMLPMAYAPQGQGELRAVTFAPPPPGAEDADVAAAALEAAVDFWGRVATDARISTEFRVLAAANREAVTALRAGLVWLPE